MSVLVKELKRICLEEGVSLEYFLSKLGINAPQSAERSNTFYNGERDGESGK